MQQIPFQYELKVDATFDNFIQGQNRLLIEQLKGIAQGDAEFIYFHGETGTGKTHLLQALAHLASEPVASAETISERAEFNVVYIPLEADFLSHQVLADLDYFDCVCVDNLGAIIRQPNSLEWQQALFNLYNRLKEAGKSLVISAEFPPASLTLELADLKSRLSAMLIHAIKPLSDEEKLEFVMSKAHQAGMELNQDAAQYLISRQQRDLANLNHLLDKLDRASLQAQRKLTKPFIRKALAKD
ncbi:DnaA regulatory inactivator Hda [Kangiella sp. TOML190]|uniref:DnaA regulatory inactivator Hda n=1 Tax=Kangiella sp. TOML190 TaxID=2931351 RepID=UPI00203B6F76|nr:DnaA regulatory inactivator Hda [Kangiella sp. TOML190]